MLSTLQRAQLAALLHDVGKFDQRTGRPHGPKFREFDEKDYGAHGAHAKWSTAFVEAHLPEIEGIYDPVFRHHKPADRLAKLVAAGDRLSSSERQKQAPQESDRPVLTSIFTLLQPPGPPSDYPASYLPLQPLNLNRQSIFPGEGPANKAQTATAYDELWGAFESEFDLLPQTDFPVFFDSLYYLLQKYTWSVPSAFYGSRADVSLFDHARTSCAITTCLALQNISDTELETLLGRSRDAQQQTRFSLLAGDLSGVQRFLYTITSKGAARGLRGRSFYLQLLTDAVASWLLRRLELPITNLIYSGGGRFYILAPNISEPEIQDLRRTVTSRLKDAHNGELYMALASVGVSASDLGAFAGKWDEVGRALATAKRRRYSELEQPETAELFEPFGAGGYRHPCDVCRAELEDWVTEDEPDVEMRKCPMCRSLETLGRDLRDAKYLTLRQVEEGSGPAESWQDVLARFGLRVEVLEHLGKLPSGVLADRATVLAVNSTDFLSSDLTGAARSLQYPVSFGFKFTAAANPVGKNGDVATFTELADRSRGIKRLGVLRMDVDDLGALFGAGLGEDSTISRMAQLSFMLRLFFEGWLNEICARFNPGNGEDRVYSIYSGGDDLFIVGSWDVMPRLTLEISRDLTEFACRNGAVHACAGIALIGSRHPLYQGAEESAEALDNAKDFQRSGGPAKNAISFLGRQVGWEVFPEMIDKTAELEGLIGGNGAKAVGRSLLQTIGSLYADYEKANSAGPTGKRKGPKVAYGRWRWLAAYGLARLKERDKQSRGEIDKILNDTITPEGMERLGMAARWAELLTRKERTE